jgi:hypothetical protein
MRCIRLVIPFCSGTKESRGKQPQRREEATEQQALNELSGVLALDGAVAMATASNACMIATPSMVRAMPAGRNQAENPPTNAAMISRKNRCHCHHRERLCHTVRNDVTSATPTPAR